ncbi:hypothetical protein PGT21_030031 [Puccinia graminis f. sp. tritici]|uniref:Uncharacterized protein n=1 Tax=Puccinia graminis f. sp. tritici TaxID=56615 RepID=A0A5B0RMS1_PUCGR|nr:hypothetical protein PGT21_030031 [Puccinia graminis f. sp. tritici]KAA1127206.1 hypothetical protein PGTUg99_030997 [Puccinia graminis f. sp. tritici]
MPLVKITNKTPYPINVALSIIVPIHFYNGLLPQQTWETQVGSVWFKFECREDDGSNRYSVSQSAMTLGLFSLTGASIAIVAVPLAITGLAPIAGSSCTLLTALAGKPLIAAAATPEVLTLTTWIATNLTRKTVYQIASEQGLKEEELEKTLQETGTLLDGLKYLCLPNTTDPTKEEPPQAPVNLPNTPDIQAVENSKKALLGLLSPEMLDKFAKFYSSKTEKITDPKPTRQPQQSNPEPSPIGQNNSNLKTKNVKESPLDSLTSVFHEFSKFQLQNMKRNKGKSKKRKSDLDKEDGGGDDDNESGKNCKEVHEAEDDWELVENEIISRFNNQPTFNANETVYIGFNNLYQFEWHTNKDIHQNQGTKFVLVDTST